MKKSSRIFLEYVFLKWTFFYFYQYVTNDVKYANIQDINAEGIFLAIFMLLSLPLFESICIYIPFHLILKQKGILKILSITCLFSIEFLLTWLATSEELSVWLIVKIIISIICLLVIQNSRLKEDEDKILDRN